MIVVVGLEDRQPIGRNHLEGDLGGSPEDPLRIVLGLQRADGVAQQACKGRLPGVGSRHDWGSGEAEGFSSACPPLADDANLATLRPELETILSPGRAASA